MTSSTPIWSARSGPGRRRTNGISGSTWAARRPCSWRVLSKRPTSTKAASPAPSPRWHWNAMLGNYESDLYGLLRIHHEVGKLRVEFGIHGGDLEHWQDDMFYGRAIVEPFLDW